MRVSTGLAALLLSALASGLPAASGQAPDGFVPVTDSMLADPDPADWLMWRRTLDSWGYSPLDQIDRSNVGGLRLVWTRALGPGVQEGTPLVYDGVLYMPNPSDLIQALDAATGTAAVRTKRGTSTIVVLRIRLLGIAQACAWSAAQAIRGRRVCIWGAMRTKGFLQTRRGASRPRAAEAG